MVVELVASLAAGVIGARFGRHIAWPFPPRRPRGPSHIEAQHEKSRGPSQIDAHYDLSNAIFWAVLTCLTINSGMILIEHL